MAMKPTPSTTSAPSGRSRAASAGETVPENKRGLSRQWVWAFPFAALTFLLVTLALLGINAETDLADAGRFVRWRDRKSTRLNSSHRR